MDTDSYADQTLATGERILYHGRLHPIAALRAPLRIATGLIGLEVLTTVLARTTGMMIISDSKAASFMVIIMMTAAVILGGAGWVNMKVSEFTVTTKRVVFKTGVIGTRSFEMLLSRVESAAVHQPLAGRLFDYGDIRITGTGGTPEQFSGIARPMALRKVLMQQVTGKENENPPR